MKLKRFFVLYKQFLSFVCIIVFVWFKAALTDVAFANCNLTFFSVSNKNAAIAEYEAPFVSIKCFLGIFSPI